MIRKKLSLLCCMLPAATPFVAHAQQNRALEEIVVTAQKREQNPQEVPISIQAFGGQQMDALGIDTVDDLATATSGLQFTGVAGFTLVFLRGIGTDNFSPSADPSVATYIDGIYIPAGQTNISSLGNIERVEVLKGPQGTLFGRNATGGAIKLETADPANEFGGDASIEFGNHDRTETKFNLSLPVTDWFALGVSALRSEQSSYYTADQFGVQDDEVSVFRIRGKLILSDTATLTLTAYQTDQKGVGSLIGNNTEPSPLGYLAGIPGPANDDYSSSFNYRPEGHAKHELYYGTLDWELPAARLKVLVSDQHMEQDFASTDFDGSSAPIAAFDTTNEFADLTSAEVQLLSTENSPWANKLEWVAGLYYLESSAGFDPAHLSVSPAGLLSLAAGGLAVPPPFLALLGSLPLGNPALNREAIQLTLNGLMDTRSYSAFAQGTYRFTDQLHLTLGGRFQYEERWLTDADTAVSVPPLSDAVLGAFALNKGDRKDSEDFSPRVIVSYYPQDNTHIYLSYSVGYKSGTFNIINIFSDPNYIDPEQVTSWELGLKGDYLDGQLRLNAAVFQNDIDDLQSGFVSVQSGGAVRFQTAGSARIRGAEIGGTWQPMPQLNPGLALMGNATYLDAEYTDFPNGSGYDGAGIYSDDYDFSGNTIVRTPEFSGTIGFLQTIYAAAGAFEIGANVYHNSGFYYDSNNSVEEDAYTLVDARVSYLYEPWKLRTTLFGKNLTDKQYHFVQFQTDFGITKTLAEPRTYGLRVNWEF